MKAVFFLICLLHLAAAQRPRGGDLRQKPKPKHGGYKPGYCGASGEECCEGERCGRGFVCNFFNKCKGCGEVNDQCCDDNICTAGLACSFDQTCLECGGKDQIPCPPCLGYECAECKAGYVLSGGLCVKCGQTDKACCEPEVLGGPSCDNGNTCNSGMCESCGGVGEVCCQGDDSESGCFESCCYGGKCREPECVSNPDYIYEDDDEKCSTFGGSGEKWEEICLEEGDAVMSPHDLTANEACCQCGGGQLTCDYPAIYGQDQHMY